MVTFSCLLPAPVLIFFVTFSCIVLVFYLVMLWSCLLPFPALFIFVTFSSFDLFCYLFLHCSGLLPCHALILFVTFSCFDLVCYLFLFCSSLLPFPLFFSNLSSGIVSEDICSIKTGFFRFPFLLISVLLQNLSTVQHIQEESEHAQLIRTSSRLIRLLNIRHVLTG